MQVFVFIILFGLFATLCVAFCTWVASLIKRDVSIVDTVWSLMILCAALVYAYALPDAGPRTLGLTVLAVLWALRLAAYITWRNHGAPEDRRYQAIRARNQPHFEWKSLYLVFGLQAVLAWIVSLTLFAGIAGENPLGWLDAAGLAIFLFGLLFESIADFQLARFRAAMQNRGKVLDHGLWRYSRHPNYFGECCVWWGFYLIALSSGGWWSVVSPLLMTVLLLKISGVGLLEKDITDRRPDYSSYIASTPAFFPWMPRR